MLTPNLCAVELSEMHIFFWKIIDVIDLIDYNLIDYQVISSNFVTL